MAVPGTMGKILIVDLTNQETRLERPSDDVYLTYLGGYGLGSYLLYKRQPPRADPLGPENTLGFFAGLLTGTGGITSNRYVVVAKSPKTGGWGDANSGGTFGPPGSTASSSPARAPRPSTCWCATVRPKSSRPTIGGVSTPRSSTTASPRLSAPTPERPASGRPASA